MYKWSDNDVFQQLGIYIYTDVAIGENVNVYWNENKYLYWDGSIGFYETSQDVPVNPNTGFHDYYELLYGNITGDIIEIKIKYYANDRPVTDITLSGTWTLVSETMKKISNIKLGDETYRINDSTKQEAKDILTYPQLQKYTTVTGTSVTIGSNSEQNSSIYSITPTGNTIFTFGTTAKSGYMTTFELRINMTTVYSMTFPSTVKWLDGETPDLSQTGLYYLVFRYDQPSGFYLGNLQGRWEV